MYVTHRENVGRARLRSRRPRHTAFLYNKSLLILYYILYTFFLFMTRPTHVPSHTHTHTNTNIIYDNMIYILFIRGYGMRRSRRSQPFVHEYNNNVLRALYVLQQAVQAMKSFCFLFPSDTFRLGARVVFYEAAASRGCVNDVSIGGEESAHS